MDRVCAGTAILKVTGFLISTCPVDQNLMRQRAISSAMKGWVNPATLAVSESKQLGPLLGDELLSEPRRISIW
jgi:hypothetical protein